MQAGSHRAKDGMGRFELGRCAFNPAQRQCIAPRNIAILMAVRDENVGRDQDRSLTPNRAAKATLTAP